MLEQVLNVEIKHNSPHPTSRRPGDGRCGGVSHTPKYGIPPWNRAFSSPFLYDCTPAPFQTSILRSAEPLNFCLWFE